MNRQEKMTQLHLLEDVESVVNVASVPHRSPFRYPGGKTWLIPSIRHWLSCLPRPRNFVEPFAGGAIVGLTVAFENLADRVVLVELDDQVAAVWQTIIETDGGPAWLADQIGKFELTAENVASLLSSSPRTTRAKAFRTIVQNRVSHGGILATGAGLLKNGENGKGLGSRWYPETLRHRILNIANVRKCIRFIHGDAFEVLKTYSDRTDTVFFVDPPYTASKKRAGTRLYRHHQIDHERLFDKLERVQGDFLMTYDDSEEVRALAVKHRFETCLIAMSNTHNTKMKELLIGRNLGWVDKGLVLNNTLGK
ncbi:MAG: DNA adenine methylase [Chloroflexi bacterium]|nr:DNA adenine methylase [Chloroflexota bacterium]